MIVTSTPFLGEPRGMLHSILTRTGLKQQVHKSSEALERFLKQFVETYNETCGLFIWTKGPKKLTRKVRLTQLAHQPQYAVLIRRLH